MDETVVQQAWGDCSSVVEMGELVAACPAYPLLTLAHRVLINFSAASNCNQQNHRENLIFFFMTFKSMVLKCILALCFN